MKLIEKLSQDWHHETGSHDAAEAFEAGFRKAREMLRAMEPMKNRSWFEIPMRQLEQLGEDEA